MQFFCLGLLFKIFKKMNFIKVKVEENDSRLDRFLRRHVGEINQSDIALAVASESSVIVVGFNVKPNNFDMVYEKQIKYNKWIFV